MTRETDVLAEIVAQPEGDAPRLVWAVGYVAVRPLASDANPSITKA